jgi:lipopolysaccharide transport system ATP-binding protein
MALVRLENVCLNYPVYSYGSRSLRLKSIGLLTGGIIKGHEKHYYVAALNNINLSASDGDRIGFYGHNGSGKTTLLRLLAKIYAPDSGTRIIEGNISSMLSINLGIDDSASGLDNIRLRAKFLKLSPSQTEDMVKDVVEFSELGDFIYMPISTYSSGMSMRLTFATATYMPSDIILLDEWLSAGDQAFAPKAQARMTRFINASKILFIASHDIGLLRNICTKIVFLEKGSILKTEDYKDGKLVA